MHRHTHYTAPSLSTTAEPQFPSPKLSSSVLYQNLFLNSFFFFSKKKKCIGNTIKHWQTPSFIQTCQLSKHIVCFPHGLDKQGSTLHILLQAFTYQNFLDIQNIVSHVVRINKALPWYCLFQPHGSDKTGFYHTHIIEDALMVMSPGHRRELHPV